MDRLSRPGETVNRLNRERRGPPEKITEIKNSTKKYHRGLGPRFRPRGRGTTAGVSRGFPYLPGRHHDDPRRRQLEIGLSARAGTTAHLSPSINSGRRRPMSGRTRTRRKLRPRRSRPPPAARVTPRGPGEVPQVGAKSTSWRPGQIVRLNCPTEAWTAGQLARELP